MSRKYHIQVIDESWPAPGHCSDCWDHPNDDYVPWDQAEKNGHGKAAMAEHTRESLARTIDPAIYTHINPLTGQTWTAALAAADAVLAAGYVHRDEIAAELDRQAEYVQQLMDRQEALHGGKLATWDVLAEVLTVLEGRVKQVRNG